MTSDAESDFAHEDDSEVILLCASKFFFDFIPKKVSNIRQQVGGVLDELSLENIRQISKNITTKFGATRSEKDECDSDAVV